jgi:hypothetical protein
MSQIPDQPGATNTQGRLEDYGRGGSSPEDGINEAQKVRIERRKNEELRIASPIPIRNAHRPGFENVGVRHQDISEGAVPEEFHQVKQAHHSGPGQNNQKPLRPFLG